MWIGCCRRYKIKIYKTSITILIIIITIQFIGIVILFCVLFHVFASKGFCIELFVCVCLWVSLCVYGTGDTTQNSYILCATAGPARRLNFRRKDFGKLFDVPISIIFGSVWNGINVHIVYIVCLHFVLIWLQNWVECV